MSGLGIYEATLALYRLDGHGFIRLLEREGEGEGDGAPRVLGVVFGMFFSALMGAMVAGLIVGAASLPAFGAHWPSPAQWGLFAIAGILSALSHLLTIQALLWAPGGTTAPFRYLTLVWAALIGYAVWGDVPDAWKLSGAALVVGAGLFILHRELRRR